MYCLINITYDPPTEIQSSQHSVLKIEKQSKLIVPLVEEVSERGPWMVVQRCKQELTDKMDQLTGNG